MQFDGTLRLLLPVHFTVGTWWHTS